LEEIARHVVAAATRHSPDEIAAQMLPALEDMAAVERAERCSELVQQRSEYRAGKPYVVKPVSEYLAEKCSVVAEGRPGEKSSLGGFALSQFEDCSVLRKDFEERLSQHENNTDVKVRLYCGADGRPEAMPDDGARLAAQTELRKRLPQVVKTVNEGGISPDISSCYFGVKSSVIKSSEEMRKVRCKVLSADMNVPGVTYDALWERAAIADELEQFRTEHAEEWETRADSGETSILLDRFTMEQKEAACAESNAPSMATVSAASATAALTCM